MKKKPGWNKALSEHEKFLKKMGVEDRPKSNFRSDIPDYTTRKTAPTSNNIGNGIKKKHKYIYWRSDNWYQCYA